jgi:hypothetical protein
VPGAHPSLEPVAVEIASTLEFLIGEWSIERAITDHLDRRDARFSGAATVRRSGASAAVYLEQGEVSFGAHRGPARRTLGLREQPDGTVGVDFRDGRPFLELDLRDGRCMASHPCRADAYELVYEVASLDRICERWRVTGPAKDYVAETVWRRRRGSNLENAEGKG